MMKSPIKMGHGCTRMTRIIFVYLLVRRARVVSCLVTNNTRQLYTVLQHCRQ
jgi:hypothetical protein